MSNNDLAKESTFESAIIEHLTNNGWYEGKADDYSKEFSLNKNAVLTFVKDSQPKEWEQLKSFYKEETDNKFIQG